ncbi:myoneurin-like [Schistocerca serialis cubense]|uniref:myoneurin-like n=1 Tax=Schistocerca serialis cubense TaxID=2023355 RepID=UPI00214EFD6A|nr:myoneurin-like [Schistocerca serialis cubense]XP_049950000.1 myoneurin-like [Schistocerca serialis cubense]XP_049950001.1 myoneurin-like [Schistocerca serialis cubense]
MGSSHLHVVWDNHISNLQTVLYEFYNRHSLADVTISCKDGTLKAHKIILSACSPYFETVFQENPCEHPVVILKEISCYEMQILLQLMYRGSTDVPEEDISDIIQTANELKVKGFVQAAVKNVTEDTDRLENDSGMDQHNSSTMLPTNDDHEYQDESDLHVLKDTRQNGENYGLEDDVEGSNRLVDTNDQVDNSTSEVDQEIMVSSPYSVAELKCKSMKRHRRKNGLKTRRKAVEFQDSLSWSSEDEKMLCDRQRSRLPSKNDDSTLNALNDVDTSLQPQSNFTDKSAMKELRCKSVDDKFIHTIPEIQIKEEQLGAVDYRVMSIHSDTRNYKDTYKVKQSVCDNPVSTYLSCSDISDVSTLIRRSEIAAKPHECEYCGLSFSRASHLARHRRVHTGERPFICVLCQRKFTRQDKLRLHVMKYHALDIKDRKYQSYILTQKVSSGANNAVTEDELREVGRGESSLPFGDTSYLSSLSFGQQKHTDSTVSAAETLDSNTDELLYSVRQLGECTIQAVSKQEVNS